MFGFRYPAVILLAGTVIGTLLGRRFDFGLPLMAAVLMVAACILIYGWLRLSPAYYVLPLTLLLVSAAILNANRTFRSFPADDIGRMAGDNVRLRYFGQIVKWPILKRHKTLIACRIDSIADEQTIESASGTILLEINRETTHFTLGDRICFSGNLRKPYSGGYPGQFDYARYLQDRGIRGLVSISDPSYVYIRSNQRNFFGRIVEKLRQWILSTFHKNLEDLPAALASGFLIGETRDIPDNVYRAFRRTGTMHLLAVSGSNVALVLAVAIFLIRFIPLHRVVRIIILLTIIFIFSNLSYNQPSVVRASIMAALIIIARGVYRRIEMNNIIAAAAVLLIFYDPGNLYDIGFQLSFAVTWGLILFLPQINNLMAGRKLPQGFRYFLLIVFSSLIATVISAPITIYYFGETSLVTAFSNLLVVPLVSAAVIGIVVLLLTNLILPGAAILPGMLLSRLLDLIHVAVVWFDNWKFVTAGSNVISADCALAFLIGVALILPAFNNRLIRRVLGLYLVVAAGYFLAGFIWADPAPGSDIEIYNGGTYQTVIINRQGGVVLYHQIEYSRHDGFVNDLIPYLTRRKTGIPRYFVFLEPRYRTEQRLNLMSEKGLSPQLVPCGGTYNNVEGLSSSMWIAGPSALNQGEDSCGLINVYPGMVAVRISNTGGILFATSPDRINFLSNNALHQFDYVLVVLRGRGQLDKLIESGLDKNLVILLQDRADEYSICKEKDNSWIASVQILTEEQGPLFMELRSRPKKSF